MKKITLAGAALLVGCHSLNPFAQDVAVPGDPQVMNGTYTGEVSRFVDGQEQKWPVTLTAQATYLSSTQYTITGTLNLRGNAYMVTGKGGGYLVRFHPQGAINQPRLDWKLDLTLNGQPAGTANGNPDMMGGTDQVGSLRLNGNELLGLSLKKQ